MNGSRSNIQRRAPIVIVVALLVAAVVTARIRMIAGKGNLPNVVLIVVDTLSAKYLGSYGGDASVSPVLDRLAAGGVRFHRAYSAAPWTKPAIASIMTGCVPSVHGLRSVRQTFRRDLAPLAELFKARGYRTAGVVSHTFLSPRTDFKRGFEQYEMIRLKGDVHDSITSDLVSDRALAFLNEPGKAPFFLFLHYFDPHFDYQHHPKFDRTAWYNGSLKPGLSFRELRRLLPGLSSDDVRYLADLYREEIAFTDDQIGRVLAALESRGLAQDTIVVVTADHGEEFTEHGEIGHGRTMYDEVMRVPLIVSYPRAAGPRVIAEPVSTADIFWTLMRFVDPQFRDRRCPGTSLVPEILARAESGDEARTPIFAEVDFHASMIALMEHEAKLIFDKPSGRRELYDLVADPEERDNRVERETGRAAELQDKIDAFRNGVQRETDGELPRGEEDITEGMDAKEIEQLRSLGYLN